MGSKKRRFADDGWALWIDGDDRSTIYLNEWINPKGKNFVDVSIRVYGAKQTKRVNLFIPTWHESLKKYVLDHGFVKDNYEDECYVLTFNNRKMEVNLPEGYKILDGNTTPDFYLSNTHRFSFNYGGESYATDNGAEAFGEFRKMNDHIGNGFPTTFPIIHTH